MIVAGDYLLPGEGYSVAVELQTAGSKVYSFGQCAALIKLRRAIHFCNEYSVEINVKKTEVMVFTVQQGTRYKMRY